jgi:predicted O-methyltransferase YrrM
MFKSISRIVPGLARRVYGEFTPKAEIATQNRLYLDLGLDRDQALKKIDSICLTNFGRPFTEHAGMWSEHLVLLAAFSIERNDITRILEIGTFKGETTSILSSLFPNSAIDTVDLARQQILDQGIYTYATDSITTSQERVKRENITFKVMNSIQLLHENDKYDLIWVDGAHTSPVSIIDIANSIRLLSDNGVAICDDVYLEPNYLDRVSDLSSVETLQAFQESGIITFTLIRKRLSKRFNNFLVKTKYLGVYKLS